MAEHTTDIKTDTDQSWPDPFEKKNDEYFIRCIDYAISEHGKNEKERNKDIALKSKFVGQYRKSALSDLQTITSKTETRYIDYKLGHRKIMQLIGEWSRRPINSTVYTINSSAKSDDEETVKAHIGLAAAKEQTQYLRDNNIANPFQGMESMYSMEEQNEGSIFEHLNAKRGREHVMQVALNEFVRKGKARDPLYMDLLDMLLTSKCFSKVQLMPNGEVKLRPIPIENAMYFQPIGTFFLEDSLYVGERRKMSFSDIIDTWPELKLPQNKEKYKDIRNMFGNYYSNIHESHARTSDNDLKEGRDHVYAWTIQFQAYDPVVEKTAIDRYGKMRTSVLSKEYWYDNRHKLMNQYRKGKFDLDIRWEKNIYEVSRIGDNVYVGMGQIHDMMHNPDDPLDVKYDYTGLLFNTVMGTTTSIQELMLNLEHTYNLIRLAMNRELGKYKGMTATYDLGQLPRVNGKQMSAEQVINKMYNDGFLFYNSSADGNLAQEGRTQGNFFDAKDLGLSAGLQTLIQLGYEIEDTCNKIIGFNDDRLGETPASSTVTNAQNNQINSQASTAPLYYFFNRYTENVMQKVVEKSKISLAFYHKNRGTNILGPEGAMLLRNDESFADDYYGVYIADSGKEEFIRRRMIERSDADIQNGHIRNGDVAKAEMAETVNEAIAILDKSYSEMRNYISQEQRAQEEARMKELEMKGQQDEMKREDEQQHEKDLEILKAELEGRKAAASNVASMYKTDKEAEVKKYQADKNASVQLNRN